MDAKIRKQIERRKRRIARRLDKNDNRGCERPIMTAANIHYEIADRTRATTAGGIAAFHLLVQKLGLDQAIDRRLVLFKMHLPYHESDHVMNIALNVAAKEQRAVGVARVAGRATEAPIEVGAECFEVGIARRNARDVAQAQLFDQAILQGLISPFDPTFGLRRVGTDEFNVELS